MIKTSPTNDFTAMRFLQIIGRLAQVACLVAVYIGCRNCGALWESITHWQPGEIYFEKTCAQILRVTVPIWLGIVLFIYSEFSLRRDRYICRQLAENPEAPWLTNSNWQGSVIRTPNRNVWLVFVTCLLTAILIGLPIAGLIWSGSAVRNIGIAIGLLSLGFALSQWKSLGWTSATLKLESSHGIIGGPFTGIVQVFRGLPPDTIFAAGLQCTYVVPPIPNEDSSHERRIHWASAIEVRQGERAAAVTAAIPVHFSIPFDCPSSTIIPVPNAAQQAVRWELIVHEKDRPDRGLANFIVPVFKTTQSRPNYEPSQDLLDQFEPEFDVLSILKKFKFQETTNATGHRIITFQLREQSLWKVGVGLSLGCLTIIAALLYWVPVLYLALFLCLIPAFMLFAIAHNFVEALQGNSEIVCEGDHVLIYTGFRKSRLPLQCAANPQTKLICAIEIQSQNQILDSWNLGIRTEDGSERLLIKQLGSQSQVESVQKWLAGRLGVGVEPITMEFGYAERSYQSSSRQATKSKVNPKLRPKQKKSKK